MGTAMQEFITLKNELLEVVQLTQSVVSTNADALDSGSTPSLASVSLLSVGSLCEAVFGDAWYPASILDAGANGYKVSFLGYNNEETLASASVRALSHEPSLDAAAVSDGLACEALYVVDGQWHDVLVQSKTERGYMVSFTKFGNAEELPLAYLRLPGMGSAAAVAAEEDAPTDPVDAPAPAATPAVARADEPSLATAPPPPPPSVSSAPSYMVDGVFQIPEHLKVLPTDTEEQKQKKRKKVKALKLLNKGREEEGALNNTKASWQTFQTKNSKKRVKGFVSTSTKKKGSIFASSMEGKVGVTGSGSSMTDFEARKKYKLKKSSYS